MFQLVCYRREEKPREKSLAEKSPLTERYYTKLKVIDKQLMISELLVEAAGVELFLVLTTRKLLIPGTATTARRALIASSIVRLL